MTTTTATRLQAAARALNAGRWPEVQQLCHAVLQHDQNQAEAWFFLAVAAAAQGLLAKALELGDRALQLQPANAEYLVQQARWHSQANHHAAALNAAEQAVALQPQRPLLLDTLGVVYSRLGEHTKARAVLRTAVQQAADNAQFHFNLASVEHFLGDAAAARHSYERALALKPDFCRAWWALSELDKNAGTAGQLEQMLAQQQRADLSGPDALYLAHALAREYEKRNDHAQAFAQLERGKQQRRQQVNYRGESDTALFAAMQTAFPAAVTPLASEQGARAIFIVGMPRSGTTLVERMLASHSQVQSLGELQEFPLAVKIISGSRSRVVLDAETITAACKADPLAIGRHYLAAVAPRLHAGMRFIDKMPLNFLYVGFILAATPAAKVVCLRRNPLDTILSNYRQLFALNFSYYNYHYDIADTARYFVQFEKLMQHWRMLYAERFHEVSYEQLTATPEPTVRNLLDYLQLPWEADCLQFHHNTQAVSTASSMQVRQPLYTTAVGRWRHYANELKPAIDILEAAGIQWE